jgi:hypothetical protein
LVAGRKHFSMKDEESSDSQFSSLMNRVAPTLSKYIEQLSDYLASTNAHLDLYRFDVKNLQNGISIDIAFKVTMQTEKKV